MLRSQHTREPYDALPFRKIPFPSEGDAVHGSCSAVSDNLDWVNLPSGYGSKLL